MVCYGLVWYCMLCSALRYSFLVMNAIRAISSLVSVSMESVRYENGTSSSIRLVAGLIKSVLEFASNIDWKAVLEPKAPKARVERKGGTDVLVRG